MKNWYQIGLDIPLEKPDPPGSLPSPVKRLVDRFEREWMAAGSPDSVALFMGEYTRFSRQIFFLPPSANENCLNVLVKYGAYLVDEPEPHRLLHKIGGSDAAFSIWCPWANLESIEYPPLRSGTFRILAQSDEVPQEVLPEPDNIGDVSEDERDWAIDMMKSGHFAEALPILVRSSRCNPSDYGSWYMAGQCYRFTEDIPKAIEFLKQAARLNPTEPTVFLSLGIAFQLFGQFNNAIGSLVKAVDIDPNFDLAYNSLALTQMKKGDYEFALHNYDEALKAMTRRLVSTFKNSPSRGITKFHDSPYSLWIEYAVFGMMFIAASDKSVSSVAMPTGETAGREEREEHYEGLFWKDQVDELGKKTRLFLPNYFNTFEARLHDNVDFATFLRSKGTALEELGRNEEAQKHYAEAEYFRPI